MLSLTRRVGQSITLGTDIEITVLGVSGGRVRLGIRAPRSVPVHRAELVERVAEENLRAVVSAVEAGVAAGAALCFPEGLYGLGEHTSFVLCDLDKGHPVRALVSCKDPRVQLWVIDAQDYDPSYPLEVARAIRADSETIAVALIVTVPGDGTQPTVNLLAPLVISLETRTGEQIVLEHPDLVVSAPFGRLRSRREVG